jgi:hypothetical protein
MRLLRAVASALHLDAALAAALGFRVWQGISGVVTIVLVGRLFSLDLQGVYYTFLGVVAFQTLSDLGLFLAIISVASHEWAGLQLDAEGRVTGDAAARSRLVSLGRRAGAGYAAAACVSGAAVWLGGAWFFGRTAPPGVDWAAPWALLVATSTAAFAASPWTALLEGCGQVAIVNRYRLAGAVASSLAAWVAMAAGLGLWALPASGVCLAVRDVWLLARHRHFLAPFVHVPPGPLVDWSAEVWPMQWRLGLQGLSQYGSTLIFTPVLIYYHSAADAGRFGMTWTAVIGLQTVALAWIQTRTPALGHLAARGDVAGFERLWRHAAIRSVAALLAAGAALCALIAWLAATGRPFADRLLPPALAAALVAGVCCSQVVQCLAAYLRATRRELLLPVGVVSSVVAGTVGWVLGRRLGAPGVVAAYTGAMGLVALPMAVAIWGRHRLHARSPGGAAVAVQE